MQTLLFWGLRTLAVQLRTGNSQKTKLETFQQTGTQVCQETVQTLFCPSSLMQLEWTKVKVKGISWPPKTDIILVSRFLPGSLIWPQILSEIGPKWIRQSLICNMCGRIFPQVANIKKYTTRDTFWQHYMSSVEIRFFDQHFFHIYQLINIYCVMTKWPTFYKGT